VSDRVTPRGERKRWESDSFFFIIHRVTRIDPFLLSARSLNWDRLVLTLASGKGDFVRATVLRLFEGRKPCLPRSPFNLTSVSIHHKGGQPTHAWGKAKGYDLPTLYSRS
jgi:hypothetical protein